MAFLFPFIVFVFLVILGSFVKQYQKRKKQPPGPLGLPIFGEKPFRMFQFFFPQLFAVISENRYFENMKQKYGNIWSLDLGKRQIIVMASMDIINEAFVENSKYFQGKAPCESFRMIGEKQGIIFIDGEVWNANRQLAVKALKDLGMGKQLLENQINEEVVECMEKIERSSSGQITCPEIFIRSISNITYQLIFNTRSKENDPEFDDFVKDLDILFHSNEPNDIMQFFENIIPQRIIRILFPIVETFIKGKNGSLKYIDKLCRERIEIESEFLKPSCVFDYFWRYRYQDYPNIKYEDKFSDISHSMFDIFFGAIDTTTNVLSFCCMYLGLHPDVQQDLRNELQVLVDDYKLIKLEMRKNCPKLLSFIDEVQRLNTLSPRLLRRVMSDCTLRGYEFKTDDIIYGDIHTALRDPVLFENPNDFQPYRFLDKTRTKYTQNRLVIPFGTGKRACPGESIAVMELFLFLSRLILRYDISLPKETKVKFDDILEGTYGLVHAPLNHEIIFKIRNL